MQPLYVYLTWILDKFFSAGKSSDWGIIPLLTEQSLCYFETSPFTGAALLLSLRELRRSQDLSSASLETTPPASVAYSGCSLSLYLHTRLALTCLRRYEQGMENTTWAGGLRQRLRPSRRADSHAQLPLPTCPSWRALVSGSSQHEQAELVLNDSSLFPCL